MKREIAILYSFLADHSDEYDYLTSIRQLLELEDYYDESVLAAITAILVKYMRSKEEFTDEDDELLSTVEEIVEDFVEENDELSIAHKMRSDISLASAIFLQKSEDPDLEEIDALLEDAKQDALRAVTIDHHGKYDDADIEDFKIRFPDIVNAILEDIGTWRSGV